MASTDGVSPNGGMGPVPYIWLRHFKFRIQALPAVHSSIDFVTLLGISAAVSQEKRQRWSLSNVVYDMQER